MGVTLSLFFWGGKDPPQTLGLQASFKEKKRGGGLERRNGLSTQTCLSLSVHLLSGQISKIGGLPIPGSVERPCDSLNAQLIPQQTPLSLGCLKYS